MKKILLAAALATGIAAAPVAASASITLTTLELVSIILGAGVVGHIIKGEAHGHGHSYHGHGHSLSKWQVMRLQRDLRRMGCNPGPIDGVVGPRTRAAIAACY